jgi:hypothetical protein
MVYSGMNLHDDINYVLFSYFMENYGVAYKSTMIAALKRLIVDVEKVG